MKWIATFLCITTAELLYIKMPMSLQICQCLLTCIYLLVNHIIHSHAGKICIIPWLTLRKLFASLDGQFGINSSFSEVQNLVLTEEVLVKSYLTSPMRVSKFMSWYGQKKHQMISTSKVWWVPMIWILIITSKNQKLPVSLHPGKANFKIFVWTACG